MLMILPRPRSTMPRANTRLSSRGASRFTPITSSHAASSTSRKGPRRMTPAQFTRISTSYCSASSGHQSGERAQVAEVRLDDMHAVGCRAESLRRSERWIAPARRAPGRHRQRRARGRSHGRSRPRAGDERGPAGQREQRVFGHRRSSGRLRPGRRSRGCRRPSPRRTSSARYPRRSGWTSAARSRPARCPTMRWRVCCGLAHRCTTRAAGVEFEVEVDLGAARVQVGREGVPHRAWVAAP